jgi:site-specific recombinase XerD
LLKSLFFLGLRNSELEKLRIEDIDIINGNVKVVQGKGSKDRYVPLPSDEFVEELKKYTENRQTGKLFYISDRHIRRIVKEYAVKAGLRKPEEVHPHTLRHSYATHLQNQGIPLNAIQELLGHSSIDTTTIYVHMGTDKKKELVRKAFSGNKSDI